MAKKELELSLRDEKLLEAAANSWSGEQMEAKYGVPAAQALLRVRDLLRSRNPFTDIERKQLLLQSAFKLKEKIEEADIDVTEPKAIDAYTKLLKTVNEMLDTQGKITEAELQAAASVQARALLGLIQQAYGRVRDWLDQEYGMVVDVDQMDRLFDTALRQIAAEEEE